MDQPDELHKLAQDKIRAESGAELDRVGEAAARLLADLYASGLAHGMDADRLGGRHSATSGLLGRRPSRDPPSATGNRQNATHKSASAVRVRLRGRSWRRTAGAPAPCHATGAPGAAGSRTRPMKGSAAMSPAGSGLDAAGLDLQVEHWVSEQLAAAPPLTAEQLCRLQLLLTTDPVLATKSA